MFVGVTFLTFPSICDISVHTSECGTVCLGNDKQHVYMVIMTMMVTGSSSSLTRFLSAWAADEQSKGLEFIIRDFPLEGAQRPEHVEGAFITPNTVT